MPAFEEEISLIEHSISEGQLILVNKAIAVQSEPDNLKLLPSDFAENVVINEDYYLQTEVLQSLFEMFEAAAEDGVENFQINSTYRNQEQQAGLFEEHGSDYALPAGYSEHQTGLAIDIGSTVDRMEDAKEGKWLAKNAANFGFILRYPEHKIDITEIAYEPWHFRYVGLPHSKIMQKKDLVLEEYLDFIKRKGSYMQRIQGVKYVVQYVEEVEEAKAPVGTYEISGNNVDGYIITTRLE